MNREETECLKGSSRCWNWGNSARSERNREHMDKSKGYSRVAIERAGDESAVKFSYAGIEVHVKILFISELSGNC